MAPEVVAGLAAASGGGSPGPEPTALVGSWFSILDTDPTSLWSESLGASGEAPWAFVAVSPSLPCFDLVSGIADSVRTD